MQRFRDDTGRENTLCSCASARGRRRCCYGHFGCDVTSAYRNTSPSTGRKKVLDYLYLEEQDIAALQRIREAGAAIDFRAVPTESPKTLDDIIARYSA